MFAFWERQRYLIDYTIAALLRRKTRNLSLLFVYTMLVFLFSSVLLTSQGLRREARVLLEDAPEVIVQKMVAGRHDLLPGAWLETLRQIRGVNQVQGRLWGYYYDAAIKANYTLMVAEERDIADNQIILGATLAKARDLGVGDYLSLRTMQGQALPLQVVGILENNSALLSADLILLNAATYRHLFNLAPELYTDAVLSMRNAREAPTVAEKIIRAFPDSRPILRAEIQRTYDAVFNWREGLLFIVLGAVLLALLILAWDKAGGLSAEEKREIGILKAIGWETGDVLRMKLWEGLLLSLTAFFCGYILAHVHTFYADAGLFTTVLKGWAVLYPQFRLTPQVDGAQILAIFAMTVLPYLAATLIPGWRAAISDPDAVMRG